MIRKLEELAMNAWPSLNIQFYDGWVMRFSEGYTRRANSVSPIYESTISLDDKIDYCEKEYGRCNLPTLFKITPDSFPLGIDKRLEERGYRKNNETVLRTLELDGYTPVETNVEVITEFSEEWLCGFFHCSNITEGQVKANASTILKKILGQVIVVSKRVEGRLVAFGYGAIERENIGIFDVIVDKDYRGSGYGKDIINGILTSAAKKHVKTAYLQVSVGNAPAEKLYDKIGFREAYRYWYRGL